MTPQAALIELLARVGASQDAAALLSNHELNQWPDTAVAAMKTQRLLTKARPATSAVCPGCERDCVMPVQTRIHPSRGAVSFIDCDKRSDVSRVMVSLERLEQWRCTADAVCGFVAASLALQQSDQQPSGGNLVNIGMVRGDKRSQMLALRIDGELALVAGNGAMPLVDLVVFQDGVYSVDATMVRQMADSATPADPRHTPSTAKREARKLDTQAMYTSWQKAYRALRKRKPNMSDVWYADQLAKTDNPQSRNASTIKKHMKS